MAKNMTDEQIDKIAQTIAAKLAEPARQKPLGCGDASSSQDYECRWSYSCNSYECGGAGRFDCSDSVSYYFYCVYGFWCRSAFTCYIATFECQNTYNP